MTNDNERLSDAEFGIALIATIWLRHRFSLSNLQSALNPTIQRSHDIYLTMQSSHTPYQPPPPPPQSPTNTSIIRGKDYFQEEKGSSRQQRQRNKAIRKNTTLFTTLLLFPAIINHPHKITQTHRLFTFSRRKT